jgi:large subunit ribosomal protein L17
MRHLVKGRHLNRKPPHRIALLRNMASQLFAHERIVTTVAKAKELRPNAEKLISIAKRANVAAAAAGDEVEKKRILLVARRRLMAKLGGKKKVPVGDDAIHVIDKLLNDLAPRYAARSGGYCRVLKRTQRRIGDAAPTAIIELLPAEGAVVPSRPAPKRKDAK